jgi:hypothetical protein
MATASSPAHPKTEHALPSPKYQEPNYIISPSPQMPCKTTVHTYCISDTLTTMIRPSVRRSQAPLTRTSILQHIRSFAQLTYRIRCICIAHVNPLSLPLPPNRANHSAAHHLPLNHALTNSIPADRSTRRCTCRHLHTC